MTKTPRVPVAKIARAHGIKGEIKLTAYVPDIDFFDTAPGLYLSADTESSVKVTLTGQTNKFYLARLDGITTRTEAEALKGKELWANKQDLPAMQDDNEFFIDDLIGAQAYDKDGDYIGEIIDVTNFGAGDLLDIKPENADSFYLLFTTETVPDIDMETKKIIVDIPDMI